MRILFLTFYYEPDLCAGSFRSSALVQELTKYKNIEVDIVTTQPNRYEQYTQQAQTFEKLSESFQVYRIQAPPHKSGLLDQIVSFMYYFWETQRFVKDKEYDFVFATSSRLFTAVLGAKISRKLKKPLYLDVRDIFSKSSRQILQQKKLPFLRFPILFLENYAFSTASKINLVSEGFVPYIINKFPKLLISTYTNGIDDIFLKNNFFKTIKEQNRVQILYAGNIGEGQGLHKILPAFANKLRSIADIIVIGDGGKRITLTEEFKKSNCTNVKVIPPVGRSELIKYYRSCDILFLHLNDFNGFEEVLPSKLFEYAATGKPILAGVKGFSQRFIHGNISNCEVFEPGDLFGCIKAFKNLKLQLSDRELFKSKFSRSKIMSEMSADIYNQCQESNKFYECK